MLVLLGIAAEDGYAFVRQGVDVVFVRPPYDLAKSSKVSEATIARAIGDHGYAPSGRTFADWPSLIVHLRDEIVRAGREQGPDISDDALGIAMLRHALPGMLDQALLRVEDELLPSRKFEAAEKLLTAMLSESPRVRRDDALWARTAGLLKRAQAARAGERRARTEVARAARRIFPGVTRDQARIERLRDEYGRRRSVMPVG